jgi:glutamyl-tRNA reductase
MSIAVLGLSHRTAPVDVREVFAWTEAAVPELLASMHRMGWLTEAVLLSTCNRVELYLASSADARVSARLIRDHWVQIRNFRGDVQPVSYIHADRECLTHLFRVAGGLDSLVLGETEILGQLKKAYDVALKAGFTGKTLNRAFQKAFSIGKRLRTETQIQRGTTSVASVAVELAYKIFDDLSDREVLVIGAGDTGEKTARALLSRGVRSVLVSNRSFDRAAVLAAELGWQAIQFDKWESEFHRVDIVVSSTGAPHHILDRPRLERLLKNRSARPLLLIDLAVPRDIDPEADRLPDVFLYNVDHLQAIAEEHTSQRREAIAQCEAIIAGQVDGWAEWDVPRPGLAGRPAPTA